MAAVQMDTASRMATVNETFSNEESCRTTRHNWLKCAETLPPPAFKDAAGYGLLSCSDDHKMKTRFTLFRRNSVFYTEDTTTGKQTSLRTKDETEAIRPQRGASWWLDRRPAARSISLPDFISPR